MKRLTVFNKICLALAAVSVVLFFMWGIAYRFTSPNLIFWIYIALILVTPSCVRLLCLRFGAADELTRSVGTVLSGIVAFGIAAFLIIEVMVTVGMTNTYTGKADCIIVLGARVNGTVPSVSLEKRLETAYDYLTENPDCDAILSGGQGDGEDITEAMCMYNYLTARGISADRLFLEERSTSTAENIRYSAEIYDLSGKDVAVITSGFHLFRARLIARSSEVEAHGIAAPSVPFITPHYMMREAVTTVVDTIKGNVDLGRFFG